MHALNAIELPCTGVEFSLLKSDTETSVQLQLQQLGKALSRVSQGFISPLSLARFSFQVDMQETYALDDPAGESAFPLVPELHANSGPNVEALLDPRWHLLLDNIQIVQVKK